MSFNMKRLSTVLAFGLGLLLVWLPGRLPALLQPGLAREALPIAQSIPANHKPAAQLSKPTHKPTHKRARPSAHSPTPVTNANAPRATKPSAGGVEEASGRSGVDDSEEHRTPPLKPFDQLIKDTTPYDGLFKLYHNPKTGRMYAEILPDQLEQKYLSTITLESGIGEQSLYRGMPIADFLFTLRQVNNTIQLVVPNTYFRAEAGTPHRRLVEQSFSESILIVMPIRSQHTERKSVVVDFTPVLLGDLAGLTPTITEALGSPYTIDPNKSYIGTTKAFPLNLDIESIYGFTGVDTAPLPVFLTNLPDSRSFNLRVHYSLSKLPQNNGYRPRLADDRLGYFVSAYKDFSNDHSRDDFTRYIERWNLQKQDPTALLSAPKQPIVFWLENTIPVEYRDAVRQGILMWNRAFEKIGFKDAIEVRQMPDQADWDPADVRYNTVRWFNSTDAFFAIGPVRANPLTGEILDADVLVDANFIRAIKQDYRSLIEQNQGQTLPFLEKLTGAHLCDDEFALPRLGRELSKLTPIKPTRGMRFRAQRSSYQDICSGTELLRQLSVGKMALTLTQNVLPNSTAMQDYVQQFVQNLIAHEIGHTLGLRHNFHGSTMLKSAELNNVKITRQKGLVGSVMDYNAVNLAPQGTPQGDYYSQVVGPYDEWAIAYGYSPSDTTSTLGEKSFLAKIAQRAPEPDLAYGTDEDTVSRLDPAVVQFDLSGDLLTYAPMQMANARAMWQRIEKRYPLQGESFSDVRVAFDDIFFYYVRNALVLTRYIGGQSFNRYREGDAKGRLPFEPVPLEQQRQALSILQQNVFSESAFQFSPTLLNKLAPSRWRHWGMFPAVFNLDYPIHDNVLLLQTFTLFNLFDYDRLARLRDAELRAPTDQVLTIPELFDSLQTSIWGEVIKPAAPLLKLSGLRRAIQRQHMNILIAMLLRQVDTPEDARTVARYELKQIQAAIGKALGKVDEKDIYTKAHLEEVRDRIDKAITAQLQSQ
jgi:Met-zincin/Domain of unknown function (DUF5117)